jgi:hypothetical protein
MVEGKQRDLEHVQADEIKVKVQGGSLWMALAIMVSTRLWLCGVVSEKRDRTLIQTLADRIRGMALCRPLLLAVDGLASYPGAFYRAFRSKMPRFGQLGRPHLVSWPDIAIVQVVKQRAAADWRIDRRIRQGSQQMVDQLRLRTQGMLGTINTAYIERLNATVRLSSRRSLPSTSALACSAFTFPGSTPANPHRGHVYCRLLLQFLRFPQEPASPPRRRRTLLPLGATDPCHRRPPDRPSVVCS